MRERDLTVDDREARFVETARLISGLQAGLLDDLEWFDTGQTHMADGCKNLSEWVTAKLDVGPETAKSLVATMRRIQDKPHLRSALAAGLSFDRVEALSKLDTDKHYYEHLDVPGVRRLAADRTEISRNDEELAARERYLVLQPSLDRSWWKLWGGLDGISGAVIDQALTEKGDELPALPDGSRGPASWRKATALYQLASGGQTPRAHLTVFIDAEKAVPTGGRAGVRLKAGPRVGTQALQTLLCDSVTEITVNGEDAVPMRYGRTTRNIPPRLHRATLARNNGHCQIFGCDSRYRVEVHHKTPWSEGGTTDPESLVALCWFHHHIAIHQQHFQIHTDQKGRILLKRPAESRGPPHPR